MWGRNAAGNNVYHPDVREVTAFILAGGRSTRMGANKAFLELGGESFLARTQNLALQVTPVVRIVGDGKQLAAFGSVVEDIYPGRGPLSGIHAALLSSNTELNLMLAVDLPFMESRFLSYLLGLADERGAVVTVARVAGGWQPLCAAYRREFAQTAEQALREGRNKIDPLFSQVETRVIEQAEFEKEGFSEGIFANLNTPEELAQARVKLQRPRTHKI